MTTRRSRGDGKAAYQTSDGRWRAEVVTGWKTTEKGRRPIRKVLYGATKAEANRKLREALKERDEGTLVTGKVLTVEAWLEHWLDKVSTPHLRPGTIAAYRSVIKVWVNPRIGDLKLDRIRAEDLDEVYDAMRSAGRSPAMILKCHRILSRAFKVAVQRRRMGSNPCLAMDAPSLNHNEVRPLSGGDARAILDAAGRYRNPARWSVALAIGLRQGEALGLCWDMVDLEAGTIRVSRSWLRAANKEPARLGMVKTKKSARTIMLPATLLQALKDHRVKQLEERIQEGPRWEGYEQDGKHYELVFATRQGRPTGHKTDYDRWKVLLEEAGVPDARLHDARHTAATLMLLQGVPARVVMEILGHSTIQLTVGTYQHVVPELALEAAQKMESALFGPSTTRSTTSVAVVVHEMKRPQ